MPATANVLKSPGANLYPGHGMPTISHIEGIDNMSYKRTSSETGGPAKSS